MPPMTPPAMGPAADLRCIGLGAGAGLLAPIAVHCVEAQALQDGLIYAQVSFAPHVGQSG